MFSCSECVIVVTAVTVLRQNCQNGISVFELKKNDDDDDVIGNCEFWMV